MRVFRLLVAVMLLGLIVATPSASIAEPRLGARQTQGIAWSTPNPLDSLRNLLVSFWSTMGLGTSNKTGCEIGPWGPCTATPGSLDKEGPAIDPWGKPKPSEETDPKVDPTGTP
jgi:hypothetical protein